MRGLQPAVTRVVELLVEDQPNRGFREITDIIVTPEQVLAVAMADPEEIADLVDTGAFVKCVIGSDPTVAPAQMQAIVARAVQEYLLPLVQDECENRAEIARHFEEEEFRANEADSRNDAAWEEARA